MENKFIWQLSESEYEEFVRWYYGSYGKAQKGRPGKMDFHYLREETELTSGPDCLMIRSGNETAFLLPRTVGEVSETTQLFVFFDRMVFRAVPKRVFEDEEEAGEWLRQLKERKDRTEMERIPFSAMEEDAEKEGRLVCRYVRAVEEVKEEYRLLGCSKRAMEHRRKLKTFPYRLIGEQMVLWGREGILECSEQAVILHRYKGLNGAVTGNGALYLMEDEGSGVMIPLGAVGGEGGAERIVNGLNSRRRAGAETVVLRRKKIPLSARWELPRTPVLAAAIGGVAVCAAAGALFFGRGHFTGSAVNALSHEGENNQTADAGDGTLPVEPLMTAIQEGTEFDRRQADGTFVSSGLLYTMELPEGDWTAHVGAGDTMDLIAADWVNVTVNAGETGAFGGYDIRESIPRTKEDYRKSRGGDSAEIAEYSVGEAGSYLVVKREIRQQAPGLGDTGFAGISLELGIYGGEDYYNVAFSLKKGEEKYVEMARRMRDSFRLVDTRTGLGREMLDSIFDGYYGRNTYMTSCLVLMEREMTAEEIGNGLEEVKKLKGGFYNFPCDALAARTKDSRWLGIDCGSLQQNCRKNMAKAVAKIFQSEVILYDEFDGDLLMVAYSSADGKHAYERATAADRQILELEFECFGKEQEFPEDLLKYMDLTAEEAEEIWKAGDYIFQMEKWIEITNHMTKMPVPEEFVGICDIKALDETFEVIRK